MSIIEYEGLEDLQIRMHAGWRAKATNGTIPYRFLWEIKPFEVTGH